MLISPPPRKAMTAISRTRNGMAVCVSAIRMMMSSTSPPRYPAMSPRNTPNVIPMMTAENATSSELRDPTRIRLRMSPAEVVLAEDPGALRGVEPNRLGVGVAQIDRDRILRRDPLAKDGHNNEPQHDGHTHDAEPVYPYLAPEIAASRGSLPSEVSPDVGQAGQ